MKAQRATLELGMLGGCYVAAGVAALAQAAGRGEPRFGAAAAVLGVLVVVGALTMIGVAAYKLREIEGLPETARRASRLSVAARVALSSVLPVGTVLLLSTTATGAGWILGLAFAVLGAAICATALLASHVEHLCGARVWRAKQRFYFAR